MTQTELDRAVARATGEPLKLVRSLSFSIANPAVVCYNPEPLRRFHRKTGGTQRDGKRNHRRRRRAFIPEKRG